MRFPKFFSYTLVAAFGTIVGPLAVNGTANADITEFPQTQTLANGALICGGNIRTWATTDVNLPGRATISVRSLPMYGIAGLSSFAPLCNVATTVHWRNLDTGAAGQSTVGVLAGTYGSIEYMFEAPTGPGRVTVNVTTNNLSIPSQGVFQVP